MRKNDFRQIARAVVIGHAVADALGVPVEFQSRAALMRDPVTDMRGFGTYNMPKGSWSDDTSMSIAALEGISPSGVDYDVIMRNFARWYYDEEFTPTGVMFDIGGTCRYAIANYRECGLPPLRCGARDDYSNGNGSLMRIHPFVLYTYLFDVRTDEKLQIIEEASSLTHAHPRSRLACGIYAFVLWELLDDPSPDAVRRGLYKAKQHYRSHPELGYYEKLFGKIARIGKNGENSHPVSQNQSNFDTVTPDEIKSDGYVVHSLEAAIWCILTTDSYAKCVLKAVNLGEDTDTVAAIAGGLAGALYGYSAIPEKWRGELLRREYIERLCDEAFGQFSTDN